MRSVQCTVTHQYHILPSLGMKSSGLILRAFSLNEFGNLAKRNLGSERSDFILS